MSHIKWRESTRPGLYRELACFVSRIIIIIIIIIIVVKIINNQAIIIIIGNRSL